MPVMKEKLIRDYFEAHEVDKLITKRQLDIDMGVSILGEMIGYIKKDIETLDQETHEELNKKVKELDVINMQRKEEIKKRLGEPEDDIEKRNFERELLKEDHKKYRKIMNIIPGLTVDFPNREYIIIGLLSLFAGGGK